MQLKSLIVRYGCPIIFLTLNPADNFSPLALFYAGEEIDLTSLEADHFPYEDRVRKLLNNPLAVVDYFHNTIQSIIEGPLKRGLFGELRHHFGTIEYQKPGSRAFKPFIDPESPYFKEEMALDLYDLVLARNMHSSRHFPTCFKYDNKRCRMRFPRKIVPETKMDVETGLIEVQRDHEWVNAYNPWIMMMMRSNHDCQFLFSQIHSLAIIHYVMKYITKREQALHAKLTIAAAVRKEMNLAQLTPNTLSDSGKTMLVKVCNKMESHREIGMAEAISHLLDLPDHYTEATFVNLQTKGLMAYID